MVPVFSSGGGESKTVHIENDVFFSALNECDESKNLLNEDEESKNVQKNVEFEKAQTAYDETTALLNEDAVPENMHDADEESESVKSEELMIVQGEHLESENQQNEYEESFI